MTYTVKELFYTLQGEGFHAGTPAVFLRFSGCNLACSFCDTDFAGGEKYAPADQLADAVAALWPGGGKPFVVVTGGEPALQFDQPLRQALYDRGFKIAMETSGSVTLKAWPDWLCVSPKADVPLMFDVADEVKVVYPQMGALALAARIRARHRFIQPMDGYPDSTRLAVEFVKKNPQWRLSLQTHKLAGFP